MSFGVGSGSAGWTVDVAANGGKGRETGSGTTWRESHVTAGDTLTIVSGGDTTIRGGQVAGNTVLADIGGDLTVQSLQDSNSYHSKQSSAGGSVSAGMGGGNASASVSQQKIDHDFTSVTDQSGIFAGSGGFDIYVGNHTQLDGAVIASTADESKNLLDTGTLGWSDLENKSSTSASGASLSGGIGWGSQSTSGETELDVTPFATVGLSENEKGTTHSAVAPGQIVIRDQDNQTQDVASLSRDTDSANAGALQDTFDKRKLEEQMELQKVITSLSTEVTRDYAAARLKQAEDDRNSGKITQAEYDELKDTYGVGGSFPRVMQALTAALQGATGGDISAALGGAMAPYLANIVKEATGDNKAANVIGHALVGAIVAQLQGHDAGAGAAGAASSAVLSSLIAKELYGTDDPSKLTEEQKRTIAGLASLSGAIAGGLAGGDASSIATGSLAGKNEAENNKLARIPNPAEAAFELFGANVARFYIEQLLGTVEKGTSLHEALEATLAAIDVLDAEGRVIEAIGGKGGTTVFPSDEGVDTENETLPANPQEGGSTAHGETPIVDGGKTETPSNPPGADNGPIITPLPDWIENGPYLAEGSGTVFDNIKPTQPLEPGTSIPRSFEIVVNGETLWVNPNATKHMVEYLTRNGLSFGSSVASQEMLTSLQGAMQTAVSQGIIYREKIQTGRWELIFSKNDTDPYPVLIHALYR